MININNNTKAIEVTKGDNISFTVTANTDFTNGSTVAFTVKKNSRDIDNVIYKTVTITNSSTRSITISLTKSDTDIIAGRYVYSIRQIKNNECNTPIASSYFTITDVVGSNTVVNNG